MQKTFVMEGDRISNYEDFCMEFSNVVLSGKYRWSGNLDAFNDILRGGFGDIDVDEPFTIIWRHSATSKQSLGYSETVKLLEQKLRGCHPTNRLYVAEELRQARNGKGPTIFDWLNEIISEHDHVTLILE